MTQGIESQVLRHCRARGADSGCAVPRDLRRCCRFRTGAGRAVRPISSSRARLPVDEAPFPIELRYVTPGYFQALGIQHSQRTRTSRRPTRARVAACRSDQRDAGAHVLRHGRSGRRRDEPRPHRRRCQRRAPGASSIGPPFQKSIIPIAQNWSQVADLGMTLVVRTAGNPRWRHRCRARSSRSRSIRASRFSTSGPWSRSYRTRSGI